MIEVTGKEGSVHSFADGTPDAQIDAALEAMYGPPPPYSHTPPHSQHQQSRGPSAQPFPVIPVLGGALAVAVIALAATLASNMGRDRPSPVVTAAPITDAATVLPANQAPAGVAVVPGAPAVAPETFAGFVATPKGGNVVVRVQAQPASAQIASLPHGAPVSVTGSVAMPDGLWRQVTVGGATGYIKGEYVSQTQPAAIAKAPVVEAKMIPRDFWGFATTKKTEGNVNVRSSPSTRATVTSSIPTGASVYVVAEQGDWYLVEWSGKRGWANRNYISREYVVD